jgi:hydroxyethylthiazole kinase-like uncharacterized protein yjeF
VEELDRAVLRDWPLPDPGGGKEGRGRVLVVGGTARTPGSVLLAAEAAFRAGAGKVQVATVDSVAVAVSVALPEALVEPLPADGDGQVAMEGAEVVLRLAAGCDAVLLGPGLLEPDHANAFLEQVVPGLPGPVVLDALGMAFLTEHRDGLHHLDQSAVVTPNLTELAHTLGWDADRVTAGPAEAARQLASSAGSTVVAGGEQTFVVEPQGRALRWSRSLPGLGVAGSGDVKSGIVAGLLARGLPPPGAAAWGVYLHHQAGQRLADESVPVGFLARDLLPRIPWGMSD